MNLSFQDQKEQQINEAQKRIMPLRDYWHLYLALLATGILTAFAGIYLGLAPSPTGDIVFRDGWDGLRRIFFALYYAGSFLLVAEGATLFAKNKLLTRDVEFLNDQIVDVPAQRNSMTAMLWVSVLAIVLTTVAAGTMLASWLGALDQFVTIPVAAQSWIVLGPPALLVFDVVMTLIYQQNSKQAELDRWVEQQKRIAEGDAQQAFAEEYVQQYRKAAPPAARRAAQAAAMTAARKWAGGSMTSHDQPEPVMAEPEPLVMATQPVMAELEPPVMESPEPPPEPLQWKLAPDQDDEVMTAPIVEAGSDHRDPTRRPTA